MNKAIMNVRMKKWAGILQEAAASGLPKVTWCEENGINRRQFFHWQKKIREFILEQHPEFGLSVPDGQIRAVNNQMTFSLEVAMDKTRILPFGRYKGTKEDFDFLGFTFFNTAGRNGKYRIGVRTSKKKLKAKKLAAKAWLQKQLTKPVATTMKTLAAVVRGHCNYYGVSGNSIQIRKFYIYLKLETYKMLNRRDQKGKLRYSKFQRIWYFYIEPPRLKVNIWNGWKPKTV